MKKIVFFVIGILLLLTIPAVVYFMGQQQDIRSKAAPATSLSFNPTTLTKLVDEQFTMNVNMNTGTNAITAVKVVVTFDSTKLEATSITNGAFAPKITASGVVTAGTASITVAANNTTSPMQGTGTIAVIRFKGKAATTTPVQLKFDTTTFASGLAETTNAITTLGTASITIKGSGTTEDTASAIGKSDVPTPTPVPAYTCNNTINPPKTCPDGYVCITESNLKGSEGICQIDTTPTATSTMKVTPTPTDVAVIPEDPTPTDIDGALLTTEGIGGGSDEVPVTGSTENTIALLIAGIGCVIFSGLLYSKAKQPI